MVMVNWSLIRGAARIFLVLAVVMNAVLVWPFRVEFLVAAIWAAAVAACIVCVLMVLQWWINRRATTCYRSEKHADLGSVNVFGYSWHASLPRSEREGQFTVQGRGRMSGPTPAQLGQWIEIRSNLERLSDLAAKSLLSVPQRPIANPRIEAFLLGSVDLKASGEFDLLYFYPSDSKWEPHVGYVSFKKTEIISARWLIHESKTR
jgi:hypothetical protein